MKLRVNGLPFSFTERTYMFSRDASGAEITNFLPFSRFMVSRLNEGEPMAYSAVPGQTG